MADKQDRWLDRETAERLLRGESPDNAVAGGPAAGEEAERLARTLSALSALAAEPLPADEELPGEAAALAAFRKAQADRTDLAVHTAPTGPTGIRGAAGLGPRPVGADSVDREPVDAGLVRIGGRVREAGHRSRWSRPARLGLAASLAVGMAGGVAVVAGSGLLPIPFDDDEPGRPAASVSAPVVPDRPLVSPTPEISGGAEHSATPDGGETGETGDSDSSTAGGDSSAGDDAVAAPDTGGSRPSEATAACRDLNAGKPLASDRRKSLESLAGGVKRVPAYCASVLGNSPAGNARGDARTGNGTTGRDTGKGQTSSGGQNGLTPGSNLGDKSGTGSGGDDEDEDDGGHDGRNGGNGGYGRDGGGHQGRNGGGHGGGHGGHGHR
ncbi:hypothetical protein ACWCQQ_35085 [Streptomyces sp. NPDC002143]